MGGFNWKVSYREVLLCHIIYVTTKDIVAAAHSKVEMGGGGWWGAIWQEWTSADRHRLHQCGM